MKKQTNKETIGGLQVNFNDRVTIKAWAPVLLILILI